MACPYRLCRSAWGTPRSERRRRFTRTRFEAKMMRPPNGGTSFSGAEPNIELKESLTDTTKRLRVRKRRSFLFLTAFGFSGGDLVCGIRSASIHFRNGRNNLIHIPGEYRPAERPGSRNFVGELCWLNQGQPNFGN